MSRKKEIKDNLRGLLAPVVALLEYLGVTPMGVTLAGLAISFVGAAFTGAGRLVAGAIMLVLAGLCDTLDGSLARSGGRVTSFGAFLDSSGDRVTEMAYFGALVYYFSFGPHASGVMVVFTLAALAGSFLTSYARARAEGLGLECRVGLLERPERVVILIAGLLLGHRALSVAVVVLALLSMFTFIQRVIHVRNITLRGDTPAGP